MGLEIKYYEAISRIDESLKNHINRQNERHQEDLKQHDKILITLDAIKYDLDNCPHSRIEETEKQLNHLWGWIKIIIIAGGSTLTGLIITLAGVFIRKLL